MNWLILTTGNLPEAYVMADFLLRQSQEVALFNIKRRSRSQSLAVLKRLATKRGLVYLADLLLGRQLRKFYQDPVVKIFPSLTEGVVADIRNRCRYVDIDDPHGEEAIRQASRIGPDYILLLGAPVVKPALFKLARQGTLNWHHGLSPRYRGSDCVLWAMSNNEFDQIGFTIHYVSEVVDGGKIILQRAVPVRKEVDFSEAVADVARQGMDGFLEVVGRILSGRELDSKAQEKGGAHYPPIGWSAIRRAARNFETYAGR
jgi:folate-dependent phosphoribosylglycinamide formyltransferase PurN